MTRTINFFFFRFVRVVKKALKGKDRGRKMDRGAIKGRDLMGINSDADRWKLKEMALFRWEFKQIVNAVIVLR